MIETTAEIVNNAGLHARAAAKLVETSSRYGSTVQVGIDKMVDGKSILSLMMLAAAKGSIVKIIVDGDDEELAVKAIIALIADKFGEEA